MSCRRAVTPDCHGVLPTRPAADAEKRRPTAASAPVIAKTLRVRTNQAPPVLACSTLMHHFASLVRSVCASALVLPPHRFLLRKSVDRSLRQM